MAGPIANPLDQLPDAGATIDPARFGLFEVLSAAGDTKKTWDRTNPDEVEDARRSFNYLKEKRHALFKVNPDGTQGGKVTEFDAAAGSFIAVPQIQGGRHG